jgi:hypothetical protein
MAAPLRLQAACAEVVGITHWSATKAAKKIRRLIIASLGSRR